MWRGIKRGANYMKGQTPPTSRELRNMLAGAAKQRELLDRRSQAVLFGDSASATSIDDPAPELFEAIESAPPPPHRTQSEVTRNIRAWLELYLADMGVEDVKFDEPVLDPADVNRVAAADIEWGIDQFMAGVDTPEDVGVNGHRRRPRDRVRRAGETGRAPGGRVRRDRGPRPAPGASPRYAASLAARGGTPGGYQRFEAFVSEFMDELHSTAKAAPPPKGKGPPTAPPGGGKGRIRVLRASFPDPSYEKFAKGIADAQRDTLGLVGRALRRMGTPGHFIVNRINRAGGWKNLRPEEQHNIVGTAMRYQYKRSMGTIAKGMIDEVGTFEQHFGKVGRLRPCAGERPVRRHDVHRHRGDADRRPAKGDGAGRASGSPGSNTWTASSK